MTLTVDDVGALLFSYDIGFQDKTHFFREIGMCDVRRENHPRFSYNLPVPLTLTKVDHALMQQETKNHNGLHYESTTPSYVPLNS